MGACGSWLGPWRSDTYTWLFIPILEELVHNADSQAPPLTSPGIWVEDTTDVLGVPTEITDHASETLVWTQLLRTTNVAGLVLVPLSPCLPSPA